MDGNAAAAGAPDEATPRTPTRPDTVPEATGAATIDPALARTECVRLLTQAASLLQCGGVPVAHVPGSIGVAGASSHHGRKPTHGTALPPLDVAAVLAALAGGADEDRVVAALQCADGAPSACQ